MKAILDAILADDTPPEAFADLPVPEHYRAVTVHEDEQEMFAGLATRARACTSRTSRLPSWVRVRR
jgi:crotonyl-CoA reductase